MPKDIGTQEEVDSDHMTPAFLPFSACLEKLGIKPKHYRNSIYKTNKWPSKAGISRAMFSNPKNPSFRPFLNRNPSLL